MKFLLFALTVVIYAVCCGVSVNAEEVELVQPKVHETSNPLVFFKITLEVAKVYIDDNDKDDNDKKKYIITRTLGGTIPGPTLKLKPGQTLTVLMENKLVDSKVPGFSEHIDNKYSASNWTNIHFHGLHIDGDVPSDSITRVVYPIGHGGNTTAFYKMDIPEDHMPGTHWMHPHMHGSTTLQVAGGAAAAIIVEDLVPKPKRTWQSRFNAGREWKRLKVAKEVDNARDIILIFQPIFGMGEVSEDYGGDSVFYTNVDGDFTLVNGKFKPTLRVVQGEWNRFRLINTAHTNLAMFNFSILDKDNEVACEMHLLAKDGIYIQDFPRRIKSAWPDAGGRADVMVRCNTADTFYMTAYHDISSPGPGDPISSPDPEELISSPDPENLEKVRIDPIAATLQVVSSIRKIANQVTEPEGLNFKVSKYAKYLHNTIGNPIDKKCICGTKFEVLTNDSTEIDGEAVVNPLFVANGRSYHGWERIHHSVRGRLQERFLEAHLQGGHPYHQHVIPFQVNAIIDLPGQFQELKSPGGMYKDFFQVGDWHDTFAFFGILRFNPSDHTGKMILHCHKLDHEDQGMMSTEEIQEDENGNECQCGWKNVDISGDDDLHISDISGDDDLDITNPEGVKQQMFTVSNRFSYYDNATRMVFVIIVVINVFLLYRYFTKRDRSIREISGQKTVSVVEKLVSARAMSGNNGEDTPLITGKAGKNDV